MNEAVLLTSEVGGTASLFLSFGFDRTSLGWSLLELSGT
jgi:hypothetical protein